MRDREASYLNHPPPPPSLAPLPGLARRTVRTTSLVLLARNLLGNKTTFSNLPPLIYFAMDQTPFCIVPTGWPPITIPAGTPSPTSFVYALPARSFSHIVVFLLPGVVLPPNTAAAVYIALPSTSTVNPTFKFLGGIGPGKESAIFKINGLAVTNSAGSGNGEVDMDAAEDVSVSQIAGDITLGISVESAESVSAQMNSLLSAATTIDSRALVGARKGEPTKPDIFKLVQRIIKNEFNFLASFSGDGKTVPLKAFEDWERKFMARVQNDPTFLERDND